MIKTSEIIKYQNFIKSSQELGDDFLTLCSDTRAYKQESAFLAISGDKYNAFEFIDAIIKKGCQKIIYTESNLNNSLLESYLNIYPKVNFIAVKDSILFLQEHARELAIRFQQSGKKLIAICGSNGKTTTKEMLYTIIKSISKNVVCTQKNNNNHIGVPLTLLQINEETEYAIVELGSNHPGEIKTLCEIAVPNIGVTTNIGYTHMEFFPTLKDVFHEEAYLYDYISRYGTAGKKEFFINLDDPYLKELNTQDFCTKFGSSLSNLDYKFDVSDTMASIYYNGGCYDIINTSITGKHNFYNLCLAIAMAHKVSKKDLKILVDAAQSFKPTKNRSEWIVLENKKIFLDAYNANPSSMRAALSAFKAKVENEGASLLHSCVILGDMNELGENAQEFHAQTGAFASELGFGKIIFIGRFSDYYAMRVNEGHEIYTTVDEFKHYFQNECLKKYQHLFIKGSRSLQLESLVDIT